MQQFPPNRMGLGMRPPMPSYGQGPSISALAQQQHMNTQKFVPPQQTIPLFVGSISAGITDSFLNQLLAVSNLTSLYTCRLTFLVGMWTGKVFQASYYSCQQAPRLWLCRIRKSGCRTTGSFTPERCRASCDGRRVCE